MTRLPKRYFKSISDYVRTYYTSYGAQRAQKLYDAVKTVTKDFTRTDPVYVRIGDDGEPEIHYALTQADGRAFFSKMNLGSASLYVHNGAVLTSAEFFCSNVYAKKISIDSMENAPSLYFFFTGASSGLCEVTPFKIKNGASCHSMFTNNFSIRELNGFDFATATTDSNTFYGMINLTRLNATGLHNSTDLHYSPLAHDAILELFNNLGTVDKTAGITLTLGSDKLALMSDEEKAIATGKGWVLA